MNFAFTSDRETHLAGPFIDCMTRSPKSGWRIRLHSRPDHTFVVHGKRTMDDAIRIAAKALGINVKVAAATAQRI